MKHVAWWLCCALALVLVCPAVWAGSPSQVPGTTSEVALLAQGWSALAAGDLPRASGIASQAVAQFPLSSAAAALAVEVSIARGGASTGLDAYEQWLGARKVDEPYALRRVAAAFLRRAAQQSQPADARLDALAALAADGDSAAEAQLMQRVAAGSFADAYVLASRGKPEAVQALIAQLQTPGRNKLAIASALGASRSSLAVPPLMEMLADPLEENRSAAADALGRLGARGSIERIRPLLNDRSVIVRNSAAAALFRLGNHEGLSVLERLLASEHGALRLSAADAMSGSPDARWLSLVRELANDADPVVQLGAARLIAPYDNDLAARTLERLQGHENPAVREEASRVMSQSVAGDFGRLRRLLRSADALSVVRAADRILGLTR